MTAQLTPSPPPPFVIVRSSHHTFCYSIGFGNAIPAVSTLHVRAGRARLLPPMRAACGCERESQCTSLQQSRSSKELEGPGEWDSRRAQVRRLPVVAGVGLTCVTVGAGWGGGRRRTMRLDQSVSEAEGKDENLDSVLSLTQQNKIFRVLSLTLFLPRVPPTLSSTLLLSLPTSLPPSSSRVARV